MTEEQDEDFASLFEASLKTKRFEDGQTVRGTVVALREDVAFVDVGGKGEATIDIDELLDDDGELTVGVGDTVEAVVVSSAGSLKLSRKLARGQADQRHLEEAYRAGLPVEGKVDRQVKGGYEVRIGGKRAFCPISQIDIRRDADPEEHVGRVYTFRILELRDRDLVVSRRALQEEEQREEAEALRKTIVPGAILTGRVASVRDYGAFVELGAGIQGLVHVSEMGWSRVTNPAEVVQPGDEVSVKVLRVDEGAGKIALGLKQLQTNPWDKVAETYAVGGIVQGRVTRHAEFGAFVELEPGVEALAHVSTFAPTGRPDGWKEEVPVGSTAAFEILSIDLDKKRIGVARSESRSERPAGIVPGARLKGKVEKIERYGVFVFLAPGKTGLIPLAETGIAKEADVARAFPVGGDVEVEILEVDPDGRRIRLSRKAVLDAAERDVVREYTDRKEPGREGFGSLADKLKKALE